MVAGYEELRRLALEKRQVSNGSGMAILFHHGMAAWSKSLKKAELVNESSREGIYPGSRPPSEIRTEMVTMLAGMILDCAKGE